MDTKHEALLQHFIHRRLQELASPHHFSGATLPSVSQPNFMSPSSILPHLYSSVFIGGADEMATDLSCPTNRRQISEHSIADICQSRTPASATSAPAKPSTKVRECSTSTTPISICNRDSSKGSSDNNNAVSNNKAASRPWQHRPASHSASSERSSPNGVPPGSHTMMPAPPVAAAPSPFRSPGGGGGGMLRTNPWQPAAHAPEGFGRFAVGGSVYSLFPSVPCSATEASAIYSQASNSPGGRFGGQNTATTFHSFLSAQKGDTLFSAGFPLTPNSIPSSSPQQHQLFGTGLSPGLSPVGHLTSLEAERGLTQLEMMARGFTAMRRPEEAKEERKPERRPRQSAKEKKQSKKTREARAEAEKKKNWANDVRLQQEDVKTEAVRTSCGCINGRPSAAVAASSALTITTSTPSSARSSPPQQYRCGTNDTHNSVSMMAFHPPASSPMHPASPNLASSVNAVDLCRTARAESETRQGGGCSRTIPVPPRSRSSDTLSTNHKPSSPFTPVTIKKEIGSNTPCQVAEVTTSRGGIAAPSSPVSTVGTKVANNNYNINIPITSSTASSSISMSSPAIATSNVLPLHAIKTEPTTDISNECNRRDLIGGNINNFTTNDTSLPQLAAINNAGGIPVGIAVARQRTEQGEGKVAPRSVPVLVPAPHVSDKSREDFRVLIPARGRPQQQQQHTPVSTCVLTNVSAPVQTTCTSGVTMHHHHQQHHHDQRTTTLTIPASSIVLQHSPTTSASSSTGGSVTTNTTTLQVQTTGSTLTSCDEATAVAIAARLTNGIPSWASHTTHNSALTPPTLWLGQPQYQTGPTVQLEAAPPSLPPLPPVGLQLVRDPISGHLLLLPAASLEHLQRAVQVWPSNTSGFSSASQHHLPQLMLHQPAPQPPPAPQPQHITLFQQAPSNPAPAPAPSQPTPETEFRILIPPQHGQATQLALLHEAVKGKKPGDVMEPPKLEILETKLMSDMNTPHTPTTFPTSFVFPQQTTQQNQTQQPQQLQYFYEQLTGAVQIAPQTSMAAAMAPPVIESGRRSQGTSPANPAEGCLTPPPESSSPAGAVCPEPSVVVPVVPIPEEVPNEVVADSSSNSAEVAPEEAAVPIEVTVQDASNQTETPPVSEDENTRDGTTEPEEESQSVPDSMATQTSETSVPAPPVDVSGLELLSNSIEQFTQREKEAEKISKPVEEVEPIPELPPPSQVPEIMVGGLGLLCALAEQRFMEDIEPNNTKIQNNETPVKLIINKEKNITPSVTERIDINRNYKSPKSEREIKKFIASKVSQYQQEQTSSTQSSSSSSNISDNQSTDFMDAMELDMRMRLAELQRRYKEKQKELSRLQHPRRSTTSDDGSNSPGKRGPGRPRKRKLSSVSSPQSPSRSSSRSSKSKPSKERSPPLLDKGSDGSTPDEEAPKMKATKDILKPPTLTTNKILTSAKFKPSLSNKFKLPTGGAVKSKSSQGKPKKQMEESEEKADVTDAVGTLSSPAAPVTPVAAAASEVSTAPGSGWLAGGFSSFRRHAAPATSRKNTNSSSPLAAARPQQPLSGYTFGSKQLTPSLLSGGEKQRLESLTSDSLFWFLKPSSKEKGEGGVATPSDSHAKGSGADSPSSPHQFGSLPSATGQKRKLGSGSDEAESDHEGASTPSLFALPATSGAGSSSGGGSSSSCSSCSSSSSSSSSKKRKPGRPKRRAPSRQDQAATETIVAKKPKSISFLLSPPPFSAPPSSGLPTPATAVLSVLHKPKIRPKLKAEAKVKSSLSCDDEEDGWPHQRRPGQEQATSVDTNIDTWTAKDAAEANERPKHGIDAATRLGAKKKPVTGAPIKARCPSGGAKQRSEAPAARKKLVPSEKAAAARDLLRSIKKQQGRKSPLPATAPAAPGLASEISSKIETGGAAIALKVLTNGTPPSCALSQKDLESEPRALAVMGGLVYAGHVTAIRAPDVYGITLDGERGNRPHIFSREEMLKEAIREVKPRATSEVPPGTRVCAYWSQQYRCLYPGTVAAPTSPDPQHDESFVNVEFDDGDSGRIHLEDIRMLPVGFPIVEYDPNPLLSLAKRRRRASGASSAEGRRTSSEVAHDELPGPTPSPTPTPVLEVGNAGEQKAEETENKEISTDSKPNETCTTILPTKPIDDEERERRKQKKREKAKKKEKLRKLLARGVAALGKLPNRKKHKKHRCEERHHHKHHHRRRKHRHHRHDKSRSTEVSSSTPASSSPAPEPATPEAPEPTPEVVVTPPQKPDAKKSKTEVKAAAAAKKRQERQSSAESRSKMAAFLPARQLWRWAGRGYKRPGAKGRGKKEFFKSIQRGKETINVGDCAVFLSTGRPDRPYIGRIETMWESWGGNMVVRVKWFYHPEETQGGAGIDQLKYPGALFQSPHADENDVQTISHRCEVLALSEYTGRLGKEPSRYTTIYDNNDIYYLAGSYDPTAGVLTMEQGVISP